MYNNSIQYASLLQAPPVTNDNLMDSVSEIRWNKDLLATSCWDGYIRFYQVYFQNLRTPPHLEFKTVIDCQEPVLSISWKQDMSIMFAALADNTIRAYDIRSKQGAILGKHDDCPARQIFWNENMGVLISLGLDKKIQFWSLQTPGKSVHTMELNYVPTVGEQDASEQLFAYADVDNKFRWLNWSVIKGNQNSVASRSLFSMEDNKLLSQITCIGFGDQQVGYGSADGRALLLNISSRGDLSTKMQYKCHKIEDEQRVTAYRSEKVSKMYMCNALQYNPRYPNWVGTCGSDGQIIFWDTQRKKALAYFKIDGPITAGQVSQDGSMFAFAQGYDWGQGLDKLGEFPSKLGVAVIEDRYLQSL